MARTNAEAESVNRIWLRGVYLIVGVVLVLAVGWALLLSWSQAHRIREHEEAIAKLQDRVAPEVATQPGQKHIDRAEIIARVEGFYDRAWLKLLFAIVVAGGIIGIVIPIVIQGIQRASLDKAENTLRAEIKESVKSSTDEIDTVRKDMGKDIESLEVRLAKIGEGFVATQEKALQALNIRSGMHWYFSGMMARDTNNWPMAWRSYCYAMISYADVPDLEMARASTDCLLEIKKDSGAFGAVLADPLLVMVLREAVESIKSISPEHIGAKEKATLEAECIGPLESLLVDWPPQVPPSAATEGQNDAG